MTLRTFPGQFALRFPFRSPDEESGGFQGESPLTAEFDERSDGPEPEQEPAPEVEADPHAEEEPAAAVAEEEPAQAAEPEGEGDADPDVEQEQRAPRKDWRQARFDKLTAERKAAEERAKAAEERAAALEALYSNQDAPEGSAPAKLYTEAEVMARAKEVARLTDLNTRADRLFDDGSAKFKDWTTRVAQVNEAFGDQLSQRADIFDAITKLPNAPDVYHALGGDLDHMAHVLELSPVELGMELASLSAKLAKPKPPIVSKAPAPIKPLEKNQVDELPLDDPRVSMEEFNRRMDAEEEKRWAKAGRR